MSSQDQVVYLEKFVECTFVVLPGCFRFHAHIVSTCFAATVAMPSELTRVLNMIRDLDHKSNDLSHDVEAQVEAITQLSTTTKASKEELQNLRDKLKADQGLLIQWAEEKVQLAVLGHELLGSYAKNLDEDIHNLTQFLTNTGQLDEYLPVDEYGMGHDANMYETSEQQVPRQGGMRRATSSRLGGYTTSMDGYEEEQSEKPPPPQKLRTNIPLTINRQQSNAYAEAGFQGDAMGDATKRRRGGNDSRRRSAAVQATSAVAAAMYEDEDYVDTKNVEVVVQEEPQGAQFAPIPLEPFIPGLKECAKQPQAARRRLNESDISMALAGKIAEVYWVSDKPEESMWYLVKVESVDLSAKTACVRYQNGEVEADLNLSEVAQEGHMLLV